MKSSKEVGKKNYFFKNNKKKERKKDKKAKARNKIIQLLRNLILAFSLFLLYPIACHAGTP